MEFSYEVDEVPPAELPSISHDMERAKMFLMKQSSESGDCLYDHLAELLEKILAERPENAVDIFEEYSRKLKKKRIKEKSSLRDYYIPPADCEEAEKLIQLFHIMKEKEGENLINDTGENDNNKTTPNLYELFCYFDQIGVGLPRSEIVLLNLSIRKLIKEKPIMRARFWGKILGRPKNYYVVETELEEKELSRRLEELDTKVSKEKQNEAKEGSEANGDEMRESEENEQDLVGDGSDKSDKEKDLNTGSQPILTSPYKPPLTVPPEQIGTGLNKKVYFVCNSPGLDEWIELPSVMPCEIVAARQIVRYFTGCLETSIHTYPTFSGNERNYLRAQIARISAATLVSPIGFFTFGDDDDDDGEEEEEEEEDETPEGEEIEDEETGGIITENRHYDPLPVKDLVDPSMSNWCHHSENILSQGRTVWWSSSDETDTENQLEEEEVDEEVEEEEEDEEEEDGDKSTGVKKEIGPPLLTPLSEDAAVDDTPPWTARLSSNIQPDTAIAVIRSNIWPGAIAFAKDKMFGNVYIGSGHKYEVHNFGPPMMPPVQEQYKIGPEIMEISDPSFETEEAYRIAHLPPTNTPDLAGEGEEYSEEEDDGGDDDDDEDD